LDCRHINESGLKNPTDLEIFTYASSEKYTIISCDYDFIDLVGLYGFPPKLIRFINGNLSNDEAIFKITHNLKNISTFLEDTTTGILEIN
jgi:predicted nuclease of predicted toxin-antitoxin system